jgi:DNA repair protein RadD
VASFAEQIQQAASTFGSTASSRSQILADSAMRLVASDRAEIQDLTSDSEVVSPCVLRQSEVDLFDYQREVANEAARLFLRGAAALVSLPTGAGKTRTALALALELLRSDVVNSVIWLAPGGELVRQAMRTLSGLWKHAPLLPRLEVLGLVEPCRALPSIRFGTVQMAVGRLDEIDWSGRNLVVFDEAHQAAARTYQRVVRTACSNGAYVVGLSATPGRANEAETRSLVQLFGGRLITPRCLGVRPIEALRERGVLSSIEVIRSSGEFSGHKLDEGRLLALLTPDRCPGLIFTSSIAECYVIAAALKAAGVRAAVVSHQQPIQMRATRLDALQRGGLDWIVNVELLATGVDLPALQTVAVLAKIGSPILFEQIIGRVCRGPAVGGRSGTCVIDPHGLFEQFGGISSYARFAATDW